MRVATNRRVNRSKTVAQSNALANGLDCESVTTTSSMSILTRKRAVRIAALFAKQYEGMDSLAAVTDIKDDLNWQPDTFRVN